MFLSTRALGADGGAYAASKEEAEHVVRASGLPFTILRPAEVYGGGGSDPIASLVATLKRRSVVPVLGSGHYFLNPVHVQDVLEVVLQAALSEASSDQTYVLAGPQEMTYLQLIERIEELLHLPRRRRCMSPLLGPACWREPPGDSVSIDIVPDEIPRLLLAKSNDNTAAVRDFGFAPRTIEAGLARGNRRFERPES